MENEGSTKRRAYVHDREKNKTKRETAETRPNGKQTSEYIPEVCKTLKSFYLMRERKRQKLDPIGLQLYKVREVFNRRWR